MSTHHDDELPSLDLADLAHVTGGGGFDMSSMMLPMMMMMMRNRGGGAAAAAPAPPQQPVLPKVLVDGVEQQPTQGANGISYTSDT